MALSVAEHPLYKQFEEIEKGIVQLKDSLYQKGFKYEDYYHNKMPKKTDVNELRSNFSRFKKKNLGPLLRNKKQIAKSNTNNTTKQLLYVSDTMAKFLKLDSKGLGNVYTNTLLTQYFTNYFHVNKLNKGMYITPNKNIIDLFKPKLIKENIIDDKGNLVLNDNGKGKQVYGFKLIRLQRLFKLHVMTETSVGGGADGNEKRTTVETPSEQVLQILQQEKQDMEKIKNCRHRIKELETQVHKLAENKLRASDYGDDTDSAQKDQLLKSELLEAKKLLVKTCKSVDFPVGV